MFTSLLAFAAALSVSTAQFVTSEPSGWTTKIGAANVPVRYKQVPNGICETNATVKSFSGYADVSKEHHVFFWFFEARKVAPAKAPLTVWISGGPGTSSMVGLFNENGPCRIDSDLNVVNNPWSMSEVSNVLYIDQPGDVGFSYSNPVPGYINTQTTIFSQLPSNSCPDYAEKFGTCGTYGYANPVGVLNSTAAAAPVFYRALQGFLGAFPTYARRNINFATSGYGGHFLPLYSQYFERRNKQLGTGKNARKPVSVSSLAINAGTIKPTLAYQYVYNYTIDNPYGVTILPSQTEVDRLNNVLNGKGNCLDRARSCNRVNRIDVCEDAYTYCEAELYDVYATSDRALDDIRYSVTSETTPTAYTKYLNQASVRSAIGAYVTYMDFNYAVSRAFLASGELVKTAGVIAALKAMLKQGKAVMLYGGDADVLTPWTGTEAVANNMNPANWNSAGYASISVASVQAQSATASSSSNGTATRTTITSTITSTTTMTTTTTEGGLLGRRQATTSPSSDTTPATTVSPVVPLPDTTTSSSSTPATTDATEETPTSSPHPALSTETGPAGVVKQANKFAFVRIYKCGHTPGSARPDVSYAIWTRFIAGLDVATGKISAKQYVSKGTKQSTYKEGSDGLKD
ncbi:Carboxypeptidase Y [Sphaceloma murrayae]|uniref:Carboxypeptidase Y n=1 Tax=Sphaceloma murrayae TaxID=2082308 RepID=A0A2K1QG67_9PEZI|nr:Carboxypeptidase Y [Sphaceloma murrayae]